MTTQRRFKQKVRARMERTGERYAAARGALIDDGGPDAQADQGPGSEAEPEALDASLFEFSDERIVEATGRGRAEWFALLDEAGAVTMPHGDVARLLTGEHGVHGWWAQTVTVDYERARGIRARHQRPDGAFSISKSKTMQAPIGAVYAAWADDATRGEWLDGDLEVTSTQQDRTVRGRWEGGQERIVVGLVAKGTAKTQVAVQHEKLPDAEAAEQAKADWTARLGRLVEVVTGTGSKG